MTAQADAQPALGQLVDQVRRGAISEKEFADKLEHDVLGPWLEARAIVKRLLTANVGNHSFLKKVDEYMNCRETSWKMQVEAAREQDPAKMLRAQQKSLEADELAKKLISKSNDRS